MLQNGLRDPHDVLAAPVDLSLHLRFEFLYGWHGDSCCCNVDAIDGPIVAETWRKASLSRLALSLCLHVGSVVQVRGDEHHAPSPRRCACTTGEDTMSI